MQVLKAHHALWSGILQPEDIGTGGETFKDAPGDNKDSDEDDDGVEVFKDAPMLTSKVRHDGNVDEDDNSDGDDEMVLAERTAGKAVMVAAGGDKAAGIKKKPASAAKRWPQEGYYNMSKR